jgi:hypothetical protein
MSRALLLGAVTSWFGGCGDNLAATIEIDAPGARWMAVRASPDAAWERFDGENVRFDARGAFDVAVVCRDDIGDGFTIRATPDDGVTYRGMCRYPGGVVPQFAITGRADMIFVSVSASYPPSIVGQDIPAGTYDVVAAQLSADFPQRTERVQVLRDVVVDGTAPIAIDIDQFGLPPAEARVTIDGAVPRFAFVTGATANGTWFRFDGRAMYTLPVELTRATDRQVATVYDNGEQWAEVPIHAGDNDITLPGDAVDVTFSHVTPASVTWRSPSPWDRVTFAVSQWSTSGPNLPRWTVIAHAGAFIDAGDGARAVELAVPDLADWQTRWMTDLSAEHFFYASWERARLDGGRGGVYKSERQ